MRVAGTCHVYFAFDIGFAVGLAHAERLLSEDKLGQFFKRPRRAPEAARLPRHSSRVIQGGPSMALGRFRTKDSVEITLWEFGAATVAYSVPIDAELEDLVTLADLLWDHTELSNDARGRAEQLLVAISSAIEKPALSERVEDYVAFEVKLADGGDVSALWETHGTTVASILRADPARLSQEEVHDALSVRCAYLPDEVVLVDWFGALLVGDDMEDERRVLEIAVAELLELRHLDEQLDHGIEAAYQVLRRPGSLLSSLSTRHADVSAVAQFQVDAAVLFEGVDNALKLLGDQYLARLYRAAASRFHLPHWNAAIERKLGVLDGIYQKLAARAESRRFELLELVIIVLIAVSAFVPFLASH